MTSPETLLDDPVRGHYCCDCGIALWKKQTFRRPAFDGFVYVCEKCFMTNPFDPIIVQEDSEPWEG